MKTRCCAIALWLLAGGATFAYADGNPWPGYPHDTIVIHVQKAYSGPKLCDGGHSLFLRQDNGVIPPTTLTITMVDWNQVDNDGDGLFDEDLPDGIDNDLDGKIDEDGLEPGAETKALDCDAWTDGAVSLQIRDADPRPGIVTVQQWWMRLVGKPGQNFAFTSSANQTVSCTVLADPDTIPNSGDETVECTSGTVADWVELASFNLADLGCVKQVKLGGPGVKAGGKTPFCDVTDGFLVDVDTTGDGVVDLPDQFVFTVGCLDNPNTLDVNESLYCPLSSIIWSIDPNETTSQAIAQIFVAHVASASVKSGKIR